MKIILTQVFVDDQQKALEFYTDVLGFKLKHDIPMGDARWLTVVSPEQPDGVELLLEPSGHPSVGPFKESIVKDGIPYASFGVDNIESEFNRLKEKGVKFVQPPTDCGPVMTAVFDDTCGNLIQMAQNK